MMPVRPKATIVTGTASHRLIRGVMRMNVEPLQIERVDLASTRSWTVSIVDTGDGAGWMSEGDTTQHILWQADEENAAVTADGKRMPIAPGDSMSVPGGTPIHLSAGMLLVRIEAPSRVLARILSPSHGAEFFEGYNRRTDYETPDAFAVQRWKISQPLIIPTSTERFAIIDLATPLALAWRGGTDFIGRGECRIIEPGTGAVTLLPDGLGYALVVR